MLVRNATIHFDTLIVKCLDMTNSRLSFNNAYHDGGARQACIYLSASRGAALIPSVCFRSLWGVRCAATIAAAFHNTEGWHFSCL